MGNTKWLLRMTTHLLAHGNDHLHVVWVREEWGGVCSYVVVHDWTELCGGEMWDSCTLHCQRQLQYSYIYALVKSLDSDYWWRSVEAHYCACCWNRGFENNSQFSSSRQSDKENVLDTNSWRRPLAGTLCSSVCYVNCLYIPRSWYHQVTHTIENQATPPPTHPPTSHTTTDTDS